MVRPWPTTFPRCAASSSPARTIAVVGLSADWFRPSHFAAKYLQQHGYRMIPVNPRYPEILGERCYSRLEDVPEKIDIVDVFRKASDVLPIAESAVRIGAKCLWQQLGVANLDADAARALARARFGDEPLREDRAWPAVRRLELGGGQHAGDLREAPGVAVMPIETSEQRRLMLAGELYDPHDPVLVSCAATRSRAVLGDQRDAGGRGARTPAPRCASCSAPAATASGCSRLSTATTVATSCSATACSSTSTASCSMSARCTSARIRCSARRCKSTPRRIR